MRYPIVNTTANTQQKSRKPNGLKNSSFLIVSAANGGSQKNRAIPKQEIGPSLVVDPFQYGRISGITTLSAEKVIPRNHRPAPIISVHVIETL